MLNEKPPLRSEKELFIVAGPMVALLAIAALVLAIF